MGSEDDSDVQRPAPIVAGERLVSLDFIRGIAVLGILLANIVPFAQPDLALYWPPAMEGGDSSGDHWVWLAQLVFVDGKFRGLFTVLFGAGIVLFVDRLVDRGVDNAYVLQIRRLIWLGLFGLLHFFLLFEGDILFAYALAGFVAIFAISLSARHLLLIGIAGSVMGGVMRAFDFSTGAILELSRETAMKSPTAMAYFQQYWAERTGKSMTQAEIWANGSWLDVVQFRWTTEAENLAAYFTFNFYETIPLMLVGMGLYKAGVFAPGGVSRRMVALSAAFVAIPAAINAAAGWYVMERFFPPFTSQFVFFGVLQLSNIPMIVGYTLLLLVLAQRMADGWLGERLRGAGRTAFTNYVGTSLVMALVFQGWAGGLFGTLHRVELLLVVAMGWAMMLAWPRFWLPRYRQGPLEWLWRCLTYWTWIPNRR